MPQLPALNEFPSSVCIHPTAVIEAGARLEEGVQVGAYAYIGAQVHLGASTRILHHATVEGHTRLGQGNLIFPYACIGGQTHDLKYQGGVPGLVIGDYNTFREYVSVHLATQVGHFTRIGHHNTFLAYSHVAHDCHIGNRLVMSSHAALAGHVEVGDHANVGWNAGVHQYCRIGAYAMVGACAKVVQDVPPFMIADGNPAEVKSINKVGLERASMAAEDIEQARFLYRHFYRSGLNHSQALEALKSHSQAGHWMSQALLAFAPGSQRGWM